MLVYLFTGFVGDRFTTGLVDTVVEQTSAMQLCKVCGDPAAGFHFGVFTCEGCKVLTFIK